MLPEQRRFIAAINRAVRQGSSAIIKTEPPALVSLPVSRSVIAPQDRFATVVSVFPRLYLSFNIVAPIRNAQKVTSARIPMVRGQLVESIPARQTPIVGSKPALS